MKQDIELWKKRRSKKLIKEERVIKKALVAHYVKHVCTIRECTKELLI